MTENMAFISWFPFLRCAACSFSCFLRSVTHVAQEPADSTAAQLDTGAVLSGRSHQALSASEISQGNHGKCSYM